MTSLTALFSALFAVFLCLKFSPKARALRRIRGIYRFYAVSAQVSGPEPVRWEKTADLFFRSAGWDAERAGQAGKALRETGEDYMARQDILKTEKEKACELARRILLYESSKEGRQRLDLRQTEDIHALVETAAKKHFLK